MQIIQLEHPLTLEELSLLNSVVKKIIGGKKDWTSQELQIQQNYPKIIEQLLKNKYQQLHYNR